MNFLAQLKEACKLLTGDQSDEIIEDAAVLTLRMFIDQDIVMLKHLSQLRQMFGNVMSTTANKICGVVTKISNEISEETKEYIRTEASESNKENIKMWGENIQCHYIPYKPLKKPLAKLTKKPATASDFVKDFSMKYDNVVKENTSAKVSKPPPEPKFGKTWLETKIQLLYENATEISSADILQSIITLLNSPRSNDEMQNDLFELLGLDKFEFLQEVLEHRQDIINSLKAPPPQPTLSEIAATLPENKMPQYLCQVSVLSEQEKMLAKLVRKEEKKAKASKKNENDEEEQELNIAQIRAKRIAELSKPVVPFSTSRSSSNIDPVLQKISYFQTKVQYPNVYDSSINAKNSAGFVSGLKLMLPENAVRKDTKEYEEVLIPKNDPPPLEVGNTRVPISALDELNRIQSVVFQTAYNTNENLLICAPTGAGKTNIALLTVVHQIKQHIENDVIMKNKFKGTEIYDQSHGTFVDLSILDVLQIFGRAGRPQFDTSGTGIIITTHDKLTHYLKSMTNQFPIEIIISMKCILKLLPCNIELVALGTVTNIDEAVEWLSYTYLFVRMRINPQVYGLTYADVQEEPMLETKRRELITAAAMLLDKTHMIRYNERTGDLNITDLGRTASHYYITCETMEVFNSMVRKSMTQGYVLEMLTRCSDFQQLKVRKEELTELWSLKDQYCELRIEDAPEDIHWKINILLQTYLSRGRVNGSSLQSDLNYISQNAVRIVRALFEITLRKNNAYMAGLYLKMAKMLELQQWDFYSDMRQFNCFTIETLKHIEYPMLKPDQIRDMDWKELGDLIRNPKNARHLKKCADEFPLLEMEASLHPITRTVLRIRLTITPNFKTNFIESHTSRRLRIIGLSTALANAKDLANWLNIGEMGLYNFRPSVRPVPLEVHISGHPGRHYCPRMMTMNKPTFHAIRTHSPCAPTLVFVSSRRQTRLTALDLIAYLAAEDNPKQWLHMQETEMEQILSNIRESNLKLTLAFGIGLHHAGLHERDRTTVEELFINQKIQVLICTATLAWGVNFPAHLVVIKGTEYYDGKQKRYVDMPITDVLQMMGRAGRPQFDNEGVAVVLVHDQKKNFYKKFLYEPFPVESSLLEVLADHLNAEIVAGTVQTKQDILDYMTWTYFFRRLLKNPSYYNLESIDPQDINYYLSNLVQTSLDALSRANCVEIEEAICDLPTLGLKFYVRGLWYDADHEQDKRVTQPPSRDQWLPLHADQEYTLVIEIQRRGGNPSNVLCPRFPRGKSEGWIVTLGAVDSGELHALKRVPPKGTAQVTFYTPSQRGRIIYTVYILSDSYMGLDQQYDLQIEVMDPLPQENVDKVYYTMDKTLIE
ncbi:hypothetical protein O3G_MSEX013556 [Manduca sexta]|uniref:U5 small nuclear ribonucleoprotein 200 kDa helicase n=1 Tax=Manduca sexta TaxID=7130 RepID=A0A921ZT23_MANSE|nr:hypothetical protein O3G_MSEX013556 [Manduca sexta]